MQTQYARATGPGAGVKKYDVITALSVMALHQSALMQMTVLRLVALLTARYNWKEDQFCVAQPEMARMWNVSERTVKREVKRMVSEGFITCIRPGVRGRVGAYRLNYATIYESSRTIWPAVGPDYDARMHSMMSDQHAKVVKVDFAPRPVVPRVIEGDDLWSRVLQDLARSDPANLNNWYMKLSLETQSDHAVVVKAPSGFVASFVQTHLSKALSQAINRAQGATMRLEITY